MFGVLANSASRVYKAHGLSKTRFFVAKYLQFYPYSGRWVNFIDQFCQHHIGEYAPVEMIRTKFMRRFYSRTVAPKGRLHILQSHYQVLETHLRSNVIARMLAGEKLALAQVSGKSGEVYRFDVAQHDRFRYEGDLTVFMHRQSDDQMLAALTFSFGFTSRHDVVMRIGGLQGPLAEDGRQMIVDVTRDLNGLRPKAAVLDVFYSLVRAFGATELEAVSMRNHPLNNSGHALVCNNDAFWEECGAARLSDGNYRLPERLARKTLEEVAAKKRKDWLARQGLKAAMSAQVSPVVRSWLRFAETLEAGNDAASDDLMMAAQ